jgi:hypothetical protein
MGLFDSLFDPGKKFRNQGANLAKRAEFTGGNFSGPFGLGGGVSFDETGRAQMSSELGDFGPFAQLLMGQAQNAFGQGALPNEAALQGDFSGFGDVFRQALQTAQIDPLQYGAQISDQLRPGLERAQSGLRNETFSQLFGSGQAAISGAASPVLEGLQQKFGEQNRELDVFGIQMGSGLQNQAFQQMQGAGQSRLGIAQALQQGQIQNQALGMQALGGATSLAQLPLMFQNAILAAGGQRTQSLLGAAGSLQNAAASTPSPLLEGLSAAGGFMSGLGALS